MSRSGVIVGVLGFVALTACSDATDEPTTVVVERNEPLATVTLRWSLAGTADPNACSHSGSDMIDISIVNPTTGGELQAFQQTCESFESSILLSPGDYGARVRLVDSAGTFRTNDVELATFTLTGRDEHVETVDFPAESFIR